MLFDPRPRFQPIARKSFTFPAECQNKNAGAGQNMLQSFQLLLHTTFLSSKNGKADDVSRVSTITCDGCKVAENRNCSPTFLNYRKDSCYFSFGATAHCTTDDKKTFCIPVKNNFKHVCMYLYCISHKKSRTENGMPLLLL